MVDINKLEKANAHIIALYIFQFGILQPVCIVVNSQLPIAMFSFFLLIFMFWKNGIRIKSYVIFLFLLITTLFLLNIRIHKTNMFILPMLCNFLSMGFSGILVGSLDVDGDELYKAFLKYSVINFFILAPFPFIGLLTKIKYMRFGYAMLPTVLTTFYGAIYEKKHKLTLGIISILALALTVIYGSRGTVVAIILSLMLFFIFTKKISIDGKILILTIMGILIIIFIRYNLIFRLISYIYYNLGIQTYSVKKFMVMFGEGLAKSSSGRERIYSRLWSLFLQRPILGKGIAVSQDVLGQRFTAHNIILQILVEFGFLGLLIWIAVWFYCGYNYNQISKEQKNGMFIVVTVLISVSLGRLMVSSDMWARPEYWLAISLLINYEPVNKIDSIDRNQKRLFKG